MLDLAQVRERVLAVLADEARRMLDEGVAQAPMDIDLAMITGAGFQFWNGGITPLLDRTGVVRGASPAGASSRPAWPASAPEPAGHGIRPPQPRAAACLVGGPVGVAICLISYMI